MGVNKKYPFECKFFWAARDLENEVEVMQQKLLKEKGIFLEKSEISYLIAKNIREGKFKFNIDINQVPIFKKRRIL